MKIFAICILCGIFFINCAKENDTMDSSVTIENNSDEHSSSLNENLNSSDNFDKVTEANFVQDNDIFVQKAGTLFNYSQMQDSQPVKLICIPNSPAYLGFVLDNDKLTGIVQDNKLYINSPDPETNLINQCESKLNKINMNLHIAKLGIRYHAKDFEIKNTKTISNTIKVTRDFFDSLVTNPIPNLNIYCSLNNQILLDLEGNSLTFSAKTYFPTKKVANRSNPLFINVDRLSIQNLGYKFKDIAFGDCKENLYATSENAKYTKIYFVDDPIPLNKQDQFLIASPSFSSNNQSNSNLVCYFTDENGRLNWHWGFIFSKEIQIYQVPGKWVDGVFTTSLRKKDLEKVCLNFSDKYTEGSWKLYQPEVADYFWSWSSRIQFRNEKSDYPAAPFEKIVVFGDSIADNGRSKKYSGFITERIPSEPKYPYFAGRYTGGPNLVDNLANLFNKPIFNWANAIDNNLVKQNVLDSPLSDAVNKYIKESIIWGGEKEKNKTLYFIQIGGNFFTATQDPPEDIFNNLAKDLKSSINKLADAGAYYIAIPYIYDPTRILMSMKQIDPLTYEKYSKELMSIFEDTITSTQLDYGSKIKIMGINYQDLYEHIASAPSTYGFQNINSPCYVAATLPESSNITFDDDPITDANVSKNLLCPKQSQYFYFDNIHPGFTADQMLAMYSASVLQQFYSSEINGTSQPVNLIAEDYINKVFSTKNNPFLNLLLEKK